MSLIENLIYQQNPELRFCMYHQNNGRYYEMLRPDLIKYIDRNNSIECNYEVTADLSTPGGLAIDDDVFSPGDVYLSVGFSNRRQLSDLGRIYEIRRRIGIKVILCIHDIIPIKFTHYVPSMGETFMPYVDAIAENADHILVDSHSTRMDLLSYLREKKLRVPATSLLHLGCEIAAKKAISTPPPPVCAQPYIALISTVEKRKNHRIICDAYRILIDLGFNDLPQLIFVGQHAHGSGELLDDVKNDSRLCDKIIFLNSVSDIILLHIYQNCLFTVYPSLYEGFGLPIVESLALGKICISSNSSSMPEAGGIFADYADPYNATEWANKILSYLQNPDLLKRREEGIRLGYRAPKWSDTAEQTMRLANEVLGTNRQFQAPCSTPESMGEKKNNSTIFGKIYGRHFLRPHWGIFQDDTPVTCTLSEVIETFELWPGICKDLSDKFKIKQLFTMFETSDVHPDIIQAMKVFDRVIVPFPYLRDILLKYEVNAVSIDYYTSDLIREQFPVIPKEIDPSKIIFLYVGTNDCRKNLTTLTEAFSRLPANYHLLAKTNHQENLTFAPNIEIITDRLTLAQLADLYNHCDYVITASRGEGVGLPMLEANYFRKPVIAHDRGVSADIKKIITVPWHVLPSREIPINYEGVPEYLHKVFWGSWWDVDTEGVINLVKSLPH